MSPHSELNLSIALICISTSIQYNGYQMKVKLISIDPLFPKLKVVLDKLPVVIGRGPDVGLRLEDRWISRIHCEIDEITGTLIVRDLGSKNGTLVNGEHIRSAPLMPEDRLTVGMTSFQVQYKCNKSKSRQHVSSEEETYQH